jgi:hypothetical protein
MNGGIMPSLATFAGEDCPAAKILAVPGTTKLPDTTLAAVESSIKLVVRSREQRMVFKGGLVVIVLTIFSSQNVSKEISPGNWCR